MSWLCRPRDGFSWGIRSARLLPRGETQSLPRRRASFGRDGGVLGLGGHHPFSVVKEQHLATFKVKQGGRTAPLCCIGSCRRTLLDGGLRGLGRRLLLPRTAGAALAGADAELHQVVTGEAEAPPQMGLRPPTQALTLLLQLLALVDGVLQLPARHLLRRIQRLPLGDQPV